MGKFYAQYNHCIVAMAKETIPAEEVIKRDENKRVIMRLEQSLKDSSLTLKALYGKPKKNVVYLLPDDLDKEFKEIIIESIKIAKISIIGETFYDLFNKYVLTKDVEVYNRIVRLLNTGFNIKHLYDNGYKTSTSFIKKKYLFPDDCTGTINDILNRV